MKRFAILGILCVACQDPQPGVDDTGEGTTDTGADESTGDPAAEVTYTATIRPIIANKCAACHQDGGAAPFALSDYEGTSMWAVALADSVAERRMPPYYADNSGDCNSFQDSLWLTDDEIEAFAAWAEAGMPQGDPTIAAPDPRPLPTLDGETVTLAMGAEYLPDQSEADDYQCFLVDSPGAVSVTGWDVRPGNDRIVHHVIGYQVVSASAAQQARDLSAGADGFDCSGTGPPVDAIALFGWAPGTGAVNFPEGLGFTIDGELPLILEVHYNIAGGPGEVDRTEAVLEIDPNGTEREVTGFDLYDTTFVAPPGTASFTTSARVSVDDALLGSRMRLLGASPHMHTLGVSQRVDIIRSDGTRECLFEMPRWDFNWQQFYWFANDIHIAPGDELELTCEFDTTSRTDAVTWGEGTLDEMCLNGFVGVLE
ncbi:MAG: hypothetical protein AAF721_11190 [Myxococcota bacterium]